jgi:hypothetical protein
MHPAIGQDQVRRHASDERKCLGAIPGCECLNTVELEQKFIGFGGVKLMIDQQDTRWPLRAVAGERTQANYLTLMQPSVDRMSCTF